MAAAVAALRRIGVEPPKADIEPEPMQEAFSTKKDGLKEDLYGKWKTLEEELKFIHIQVKYSVFNIQFFFFLFFLFFLFLRCFHYPCT